ncbi:diguanylate cyclase [[Bacillus] selenitireducens MLS10]|uniref:Diguanylate cyclase n=2 Tax=Salisediminibacterium selenitireducens TaxID=85683 RepID=D6Y1H8_BACIE|nr:diguanylate cyclase [[Bacillus] selenitireducens MLS10]
MTERFESCNKAISLVKVLSRMQWVHPYPYYLFLVGLLSLGLIIPLIRPPRTYGRNYLSLILSLAGVLLMLVALELFVTEEWAMLLLRNLQQIPLFFTPIVLFGLAREYSGYDSVRTVAWMALLSVPCLFFTGLIFSDEYHGLFRIESSIQTLWGLTQIQVEQTTLGFILSIYPIGVAVISGGIMLQNLIQDSPVNRAQHLLMFITYLIPLLNIIAVPLIPATLPGQMGFGFSIMAILLFILYYRFNLLVIWPVAKDRIFDAMKEGVLIFDRQYRLLEMNHAASDWLGRWAGSDMENGEEDVVSAWLEEDPAFHDAMRKRVRANTEREMVLEPDRTIMHLEVRSFPIARSRSGDEATLVIINDITAHKRYEDDLIRQATEDYLTGIANRRHFIDLYQKRHEQDHGSGSLLLLDLDHFKRVNDTYGHQTGDHVLRHFASLLESFFRDGFCGRIGGEEFGVYLPLTCDAAVEKARMFQDYLRDNPYVTTDKERIFTPVSTGVTEISADAPDFETVYRQADEAMYLAKENGRNQVVCHRDSCKQDNEQEDAK